MKITGIVKSAEEITEMKDLEAFFGTNYYYTTDMNKMAGQRIEIVPYDGTVYVSASDYTGAGYNWKAGWFKNIQTETDWSKVPVDAKVRVKTVSSDLKRHFAKFENGAVHTWDLGTTSWSAPGNYLNTSLWSPNDVELVEE